MIQVVMPAYNVETYLDRAVNSILAQTYPHWKLVIVNDGSTDKTLRIAQSYARKDPRIKVIHQDNQGVCHARNAGFAALYDRHPYTLFADADDEYEPDAFALLYYTAAARHPRPILGGLWRRISQDSVLENPLRKMDPHIEELTLEALLDKPTQIQTPGCYLIRTEWVSHIGGFDPAYTQGSEDVDYIFRIAQEHPIDHIYTDVFRYRKVPDSLSSTEVCGTNWKHVLEKHRQQYRETRPCRFS